MSRFPLPRKAARDGFTLVELLVVIAIIGVLVALLLPAVQAAREAARRMSCQNNVKQLSLGIHNHHDTLNMFPPGGQGKVYAKPSTTSPPPLVDGASWLVFILPYIEQQNTYDKYNQAVSWNNAINLSIGSYYIKAFHCPSGTTVRSGAGSGEDSTNPTERNHTHHYYGVMGPTGTATISGQTVTYTSVDSSGNAHRSSHGILNFVKEDGTPIAPRRMADITDGTSNTFLTGERSVVEPTGVNSYRSWVRGFNGAAAPIKNLTNPIGSTNYNGSNNFADISFGAMHPAGCNFGMADGSVKFVSKSSDMNVLKAMASMNMGESVSLDQ